MKNIKFLSIIMVQIFCMQMAFGQSAEHLDKGRDAGTQPGPIVAEETTPTTQDRVQNPYSPDFSDADIPGTYPVRNHTKDNVVDTYYPSDLDNLYDELGDGASSQEMVDRINQLDNQIQQLIQYNELLRKENEIIKKSLNACCSVSNADLGTTNAYVMQNAPNPFSKSSAISYFIPTSAKEAQITISNVQGEVLKTFVVGEKGFGEVNMEANFLATGTYVYSLYVDGEFVDSKLMMITK